MYGTQKSFGIMDGCGGRGGAKVVIIVVTVKVMTASAKSGVSLRNSQQQRYKVRDRKWEPNVVEGGRCDLSLKNGNGTSSGKSNGGG